MKKFISLALSIFCAFSFSVFAFSGCGNGIIEVPNDNINNEKKNTEEENNEEENTEEENKEEQNIEEQDNEEQNNEEENNEETNYVSDVVTEEEWKSAMSKEAALNVTMRANINMVATATDNGETITQNVYEVYEAKTALNKVNVESSETGGNVIGSMYYKEEAEISGNEIITNSAGWTLTCYSSCSVEQLTYVYKSTELDKNDEWTGKQGENVSWIERNSYSAYSVIADALTEFADNYEDFEYIDGAYKTYIDGVDIFIKINDGYMTSYVGKYTQYRNHYTSENMVSVIFSNYGTTTVEIPEEYTYEYYLANHS